MPILLGNTFDGWLSAAQNHMWVRLDSNLTLHVSLKLPFAPQRYYETSRSHTYSIDQIEFSNGLTVKGCLCILLNQDVNKEIHPHLANLHMHIAFSIWEHRMWSLAIHPLTNEVSWLQKKYSIWHYCILINSIQATVDAVALLVLIICDGQQYKRRMSAVACGFRKSYIIMWAHTHVKWLPSMGFFLSQNWTNVPKEFTCFRGLGI